MAWMWDRPSVKLRLDCPDDALHNARARVLGVDFGPDGSFNRLAKIGDRISLWRRGRNG
jgi:hypothetical protein